jgi:hypothetical protein
MNMRYINYETGDVPPHMRDVSQKCPACGAAWVGPAGFQHSQCSAKMQATGQEAPAVSAETASREVIAKGLLIQVAVLTKEIKNLQAENAVLSQRLLWEPD